MKKLTLLTLLLSVVVMGTHALFAAGGDPGPPCYVDPSLRCLDVVDPVECVKAGEGWKTYSNRCYALLDCALGKTCRPTGG